MKKQCKFCGKEFYPEHHNIIFCCDACRNQSNQKKSVQKSIEKFAGSEENLDFVVCKICGLHSRDITTHIKLHGYTKESYTKEFSAPIIASNYRKEMSDKVLGKNNPGYKHNGKLSPFSTKFKYYTPTKRIKAIQKAKKSIKDNCSCTCKLDYYLKRGYSEDEAREMLSKRQQTFSLKRCIEKYGTKKGNAVWKKRQEKWQNTLQSKSQEEIARINKAKLPNAVSKIEKEFVSHFEGIEKQFPIGNYLVDAAKGKKVIEFYGDLWHGNPKKYRKDQINCFGENVSEIWKKDRKRIQAIESRGYNVKIVWESDYRQNKDQVVQECKEFLGE